MSVADWQIISGKTHMNDSFILPSKLPPKADAEFSKTSKIPAENKHVFYPKLL